MKMLFGFLFVALTSFTAQAGNDPLEAHMKDLDKNYKAILKQIGSAEKNPASIVLFQAIEKTTYECIVMLPKAIRVTATEAEARVKQILYMRMMSQLLMMVLDGEEALQKNDNAAAKAVLAKMAEMKFQGHQIFKP